MDPGTVFIFKIEKLKFAEICEKKLNYWETPSGKQSCWTTIEIVAFEMLQIFQMQTEMQNSKFPKQFLKQSKKETKFER